MKVLISSIVDLDKTTHNRLHQFVKYLSEKHDITVISVNDWWKEEQVNIENYNEDFRDILNKIEVIKLTDKKMKPIFQELTSFRCVPKILKDLGYEDFDSHLNYNTIMFGYFIAKKMASAGIGTVYDLADDLPEMIRSSPQINPFLRGFGYLLGKAMLRENIRISKKVTCTNEYLKLDCSIPDDKAVIIPNGVNTTSFKRCQSDVRKKLGIGEGEFVLGYVGVLREWVDFKPVYKAIEDLNVKLLIVGEEGRLYENQRLAKKFGVSNKVIFAGTVPYSEVPKYMSSMDVCLIPFNTSKISENALPLKLFEYMACEKPVISTKLKGIEKAVNNHAIYVLNYSQLKNAIVMLMKNEELRINLEKRGREFVVKYYDWSTILKNLGKIIEDLEGYK